MRIAIISDTHVCEVARAFNDNCAVAVDWIDAAGVDLVVHLGDVTSDGVGAADHFQTARRLFAGLKTPIRFIPGNHDVGDNPAGAEPTHEPQVEPSTLATFRSFFGDDHWVLKQSDWTLIGLDSQLFGRGDALEDDQFAWLASALASVSGRIGLFVHKPLFRDAPGDGHRNPRYTPAAARRRLLERLAPHDWRFIVSGHVHQWRQLSLAGVDHIWAPSAAFVIPDLVQETIGEKTVGLLLLELGPDGHTVSLHRPTGMARHDIADHADVYPQLTAMLAELRAAAGTKA